MSGKFFLGPAGEQIAEMVAEMISDWQGTGKSPSSRARRIFR